MATLSNEFLEPIIKIELSKQRFANLGGFILGFGLDAVLFGMMIIMFIHWVSYVPTERLHIKLVLYWVIIAGTALTAYNTHLILYHFVKNFGKWAPLVTARLVGWWAIFDTVVVIPIQAFYAERAFRLMGNNYWVLGAIIVGMCCQSSASIAVAVITASSPGIDGVRATRTVVYLWLSSTLFTDMCLTGFIIYGLLKSKTGYSETSRLINKLVAITVESSLAATLAAVGFMINYCVAGDTNLFLVFWEAFHPKLYILPFIAVLNSKIDLQREFTSRGGTSEARSGGTFAQSSTSSDRNSIKLDRIKIDTNTFVEKHTVLPYQVGLNRRILDDESSIGGATSADHHGDSTTGLNTFQDFRPGNAV